ncbi:MAG: glycoside hydrolase family 65 protein [Chloroflexota bacterium]|nr:glycoside hydrolase family 65 protein [Chloroflexota bacterium]
MAAPINPPAITQDGRDDLPAYLSNGLIGLRVLDIPIRSGVAIVSGLAGRHPVAQVEAAAEAPYPLTGDLQIGGVWLSEAPTRAVFRRQSYDFSCGELRSEFEFRSEGATGFVEVLTFCSRTEPTIVAQEMTIRVSEAVPVTLRAGIDPGSAAGEWIRRETATPGEDGPVVDGSMLWGTLGGMGQVGVAYVTELVGDDDATLARQEWGEGMPLASDYAFDARPGREVRLRQLTAVVPSVMHGDPDRQAVRQAARAGELGWDVLRDENHAAWDELWKGRITLVGAERRWQELTDAAFYYLNSSVHAGSPSSTSIFGLATWHDYHYYYGHIMWDLDSFVVPPLILLQPDAARSLLEFRSRTRDAARKHANLYGRNGFQFPWEASMSRGEEVAPGGGKASWYEDHVTLDVASAFIWYAHITGDEEFAQAELWPLLHGVCDWLQSRVTETPRGVEIHRAMGIAEKTRPSNNEAYTNMSARVVLNEAIALAGRMGKQVPSRWRAIAKRLVIPTDAAGTHITSYDGWQSNHEKGATPSPLAGLFPLWYHAGDLELPTLRRYLELASAYIGSPMLSALYGVWAAWSGDRELSARLLEEGYAQFDHERFHQTLEMRADYDANQPKAGPFFANIGGYLDGLLLGLPGIRPSPDRPSTWARRPVVLPAGWDAIEVERIWVRGEPASLEARHGAERATITAGG